MREVSELRIDETILHILNPRGPERLVLSERALPIEHNQQLTDYFVDHIRNSLGDPYASAAQFIALTDGQVSGICQSLLSGATELVAGSQLLARKLYEVIESDGRISAGDLAICFYNPGSDETVPRHLALLKIDPSDAFRHRTEYDSSGNLYVDLEIQTSTMPTTKEKLHKCAFVQPLDPRPEYDMLILDRQVRATTQAQIAKFFTRDFLGAELALDDHQRTDRLYKGLVSAHNYLRPRLEPHESQSLSQAIEVLMASGSVNVGSWIESLSLSQPDKETINEVITQVLPDRQFQIDRSFADQLTRKRRFRGDYGLKLEVAAENFDQVIESEEQIDSPGAPPYWRVVIRTERWEELSR